ncbi:multi antimicrobial extrusion protein MatE [Domibacillus sp. PGB-M46]|uniref:multi antimicrobial extrusion protein MatE n=1 Tax=Domibacillus sp. PGB-M46 TaxID=2910255 RepID=UPI001F57BC11|nr:multi antimicrobial extrusion protein MatE [Domibacillus sp. PGB-M46]MCI2255231.1 multi antimicrobial extrusion protein MatE [Domibacillus sp. PGB-M46]
MEKSVSPYSFTNMLIFFIPLGFSASLTAITHLIINGTLSRADHAEVVIASYAIALSLFGIIERPVLVFRQTCSALVKNEASFRLLSSVFVQVSLLIFVVCALIGYTPLGHFTFIHLFNTDETMLASVTSTFRVITFVIFFSGLRCLYQGIIINHFETKWVTIGVVVRLFGMFLVAYYFVWSGHVNHSIVGAIIFLTGMAIECIISVWRGHRIVKKEMKRKEPAVEKRDIYAFYTPLVFYLSFQTVIIPVIYAFLGNIKDAQTGMASFAMALSITNLVLSFFMYTHQIVLQFFKENRRSVIQCVIVFSIVPSLLLAFLCYSPAGIWFMMNVMGTNLALAESSLAVLQFFILKTFLFPWVDFFGGILMLHKNTKSMVAPQVYNLAAVTVSSFLLVQFVPHLNGSAGAIAASLGELVGLLVVMRVVFHLRKRKSGHPETAV